MSTLSVDSLQRRNLSESEAERTRGEHQENRAHDPQVVDGLLAEPDASILLDYTMSDRHSVDVHSARGESLKLRDLS